MRSLLYSITYRDEDMLSNTFIIDLFVVCWFLGIWMLFPIIQSFLLQERTSVNQHLAVVCDYWMGCMLERKNRTIDTQLIGHAMCSCTIFASTSILILAGLLGSLGAIDHIHVIISQLSFATQTSQSNLETKISLFILMLVFSFCQFTLSLLKFKHCCALIGAAPPPPVPDLQRSSIRRDITMILTQAMNIFNSGMRAYCFAFALLAWFIHPIALMVAEGGVAFLLVYHQGFSPARRYIALQVSVLQRRDGGKNSPQLRL